MLPAAKDAAAILASEGIDATVYDPRVVLPLDPAMIDDIAGHDCVVSIEDGLRMGGAGAEVSALGERGASCRVRVLGVPTEYVRTTIPTSFMPDSGSTARASPPACALL